MIWNLHSRKLKTILAAFTLYLLHQPAFAQSPVEVSVTVKGEILTIDAKTKSLEPAQRMNPDPAYLELAFPASQLGGKPFSKLIDKGLVKRVETAQTEQATLIRIYVLSKPRASLTNIDGGYRYTISINDMANAPNRVSTVPATAPVAKPAPETVPPAATKPSQVGPSAPVTVVFQSVPVAKAVSDLAAKAGLNATVDPQISGTVTQSFTEVPFESALRQILQPFGDSVETTYVGKQVSVKRKPRPVTSATPANSSTAKPTAAPAAKPAAVTPSQTPASQAKPPATNPSKPPVAADKPPVTTNPLPTTPAKPPVAASKPSASPTPRAKETAVVPPATNPATAATPSLVREYFPFKGRSAEKALKAAQLAFPNLSYMIDPALNVLLVEGTPQEIQLLENFLRAQSPK